MRPALRPGLLPVWRDRDTVQLGIDPRRAVAITGMTSAADVIRLLDGSRERADVVAEAERRGVPAAVTERILSVLAGAGALIDYPVGMLRSMPDDLRQQLLPALAAASVSGQDGDFGASLLARRDGTRVVVCGDGPVPALVADLLTQSGLAAGTAQSADPARLAHDADIAVLVGRQSPALAADLVRLRICHLPVTAGEAIAVVGPLVRPGAGACLRCVEQAKSDRDASWPLVLAQAAERGADPPACDPILTSAVAAQAAAHVVAFADRSPLANTLVNGTLELVLPDWQWRRRTWLPHPACICRAAAAA